MPYFTRYFRGTHQQQQAAASLARTVGTQERLTKSSLSVAASRDYCAYLDNTIWAFLADDREGFKSYSTQNLQIELVRLESDFSRIIESAS